VSRTHRTLLAAVLLLPLVAGAADEPKPAALGPVTVSGLVDAYYTANLGEPQDVADPLRAYDGPTGFRFNYAQVSLAMDAAPAGFHLDLGFGPESTSATNLFVLQAFASLKLGKTTLDLGRFVTPAGVEAFQTNLNWLYSRSLLYWWAIPGTHQGVRVTLPLTEHLTIAGYLTNGWDGDTNGNAFADPDPARFPGSGYNVLSPYKTGIVSLAYAGEGTTGALNLYYGREPGATDDRFLVDVVAAHEFGVIKTNLQADFGQQGDAQWYGVSVSAAYDRPSYRISARGEWFADPDGFRVGGGDTDYYEGTLGAAYKVGSNAELRGELRLDGASNPVLNGGDTWSTFTVGAVAWF
jgi:hypothetical protein